MKTKVEILEKHFGVVNTPINNKAPLETQLQLVTQAALLAMQEYAELFASQFKQSSPEGEGWISVEDRWPEGDVLLLTTSQAYTIGDWYEGRWRTQNDRWNEGTGWTPAYSTYDITHWMPLPSPPKSEQPQEGHP